MPAPPIAAPPWQVLLFFEQNGQGWSEKYMIPGPLETVEDLLNDLIDLRKDMLTVHGRVVYARISDQSKKGDAYVVPLLGAAGDGTIEEIPAPPCVALDLRQQTSTGAHATRFIHGAPYNSWTESMGVDPASDFFTPLGLYLAWLIENTILYIKDPQTTAYDIQAVSTVIPRTFGCRKVGLPFGLSRGRRADATE